jgi:beta-glucosidase
MKKTSLLLCLLCIILCTQGQNAKSIKMNSFIDSLLSKMTLEEKVGQMNQYNGFWEITGPVPKDGDAKMKYEHLKKGLVGSVLNVKGVENVRKLQEIVVKESRVGIPLLFGFDVIHGHKTLSPIPLGESASWDVDAIEKSARMAAVEASAVGINWTFAPMVDICRDPRWGRVMEGAGEDPYLGSKIGVARINGFQGNDLSANNTIAACAKHFAGYGFAEAGRDYNTVDVGTTTLYNIIFPPFKAAVENNVQTVMNSFNVLNGIPATANSFLQREVLKNSWNFNGFVISDWGSGGEMIAHGFAKDAKDVAMLATNAGSDMDMESMANIKYLKQLVEENKVDVNAVNDAVKRILKVKYELGLFDDPYRYCNAQREKEEVSSIANNATALDMAKKSIVLLKNDKIIGKQNTLLPLQKNQKNIAIIGALANDKTSPLGSWRIGSDDGTAVSVLEGFKKYTTNFTYAKGADVTIGKTDFINEIKINETDKSGFAAAVALAKKAEVVIMVLGEHGFQTGEGRSKTNLNLPGVQQELLEAVYKVNKNIVLVMMNGRPLTINWAANNIPTIVETWQLGTQSGNAIADVLFGEYNPSGKLPITFPRSVGQIPIYYNHYNTGRPGPIDLVFWSHFGDEKNTPLYPFGYGLSYTNFEYSHLKIDNSNTSAIKVSATIKNTGKYAGEELVQLYIRDKVASIVRPVKELKGFEKIMLQPNESKKVTFILTDKELGFYNDKGIFIVEPGEFEVMVGTNSDIGLKGNFEKNK